LRTVRHSKPFWAIDISVREKKKKKKKEPVLPSMIWSALCDSIPEEWEGKGKKKKKRRRRRLQLKYSLSPRPEKKRKAQQRCNAAEKKEKKKKERESGASPTCCSGIAATVREKGGRKEGSPTRLLRSLPGLPDLGNWGEKKRGASDLGALTLRPGHRNRFLATCLGKRGEGKGKRGKGVSAQEKKGEGKRGGGGGGKKGGDRAKM